MTRTTGAINRAPSVSDARSSALSSRAYRDGFAFLFYLYSVILFCLALLWPKDGLCAGWSCYVCVSVWLVKKEKLMRRQCVVRYARPFRCLLAGDYCDVVSDVLFVRSTKV